MVKPQRFFVKVFTRQIGKLIRFGEGKKPPNTRTPLPMENIFLGVNRTPSILPLLEIRSPHHFHWTVRSWQSRIIFQANLGAEWLGIITTDDAILRIDTQTDQKEKKKRVQQPRLTKAPDSTIRPLPPQSGGFFAAVL